MSFFGPRKIKRDTKRTFFYRQSRTGRWIFVLMMLTLIVAIPAITSLQFDSLQLSALNVIGYAPTATPLASERANQAQAYFENGDINAALTYYEMSVKQQPENINYLYEYGRMLVELDRSEEAAPIGDKIIQLAPKDPRGYALKANALMWTDPEAAIPAAIQGMELGIPFAPLPAALAVAYTNIGRYQEALQRGDQAIKFDPADASARRAYSYPLIFTGRYTEAIAQLEKAIAINPNLAAAYFELASLYRRVNQPRMSVAIYNRVLEIDPNNARAYLRLCETYAAVGEFKTAEPFCDQALEIDPKYASAHRMLGQLRYSRRNYEGAIEEFQTCIDLGSEEIECYYIRGLAHYFLGECDDAWKWLNDSLARAADPSVVNSINIGLGNIRVRCAGYQDYELPTPIPPTVIPPTPIGAG
jgi:tetratricopeptide (TPR) repeat protein